MSESTSHKELMLAMGSAGGRYDPTAPEWYMRLMTSNDPVEQLMGWMQYRTVRYPIHMPYACDELGNVLTVHHLAAHFHWTQRKAQHVWQRAAAKHYVRKAEGKLWLRADFKVKYPILSEDGPANVVSIKPTEAFLDSLAPYLREQVSKLPATRIAELAGRWTAWDKARKDVEADAMQAARETMKPYEVALFGEYKVAVKSLPAREEKRAKSANVHVTMDLFDFAPVPKGAQSSAVLNPNGEEKQPTVPTARHAIESAASPDPRAAGQSSVGRNSNGGAGTEVVAHSTARTSSSRPTDQTSAAVLPAGTKASQPPLSDTAAESPRPRKQPKTAADLAPVAAAMLTVDITETLAVKQLFGFCRDEAPDCTPEEVAHWVSRKIAIKQGKRVPNWIGYLHTAVPPCFERAGFEAWRAEQRAFDATESETTNKQRQDARYILDAPHPPDDHGHVDVYDEQDRAWARRILGERAEGAA